MNEFYPPWPARRLIVATEFWFGATGQSLAEGLRRLRWDVDEVNLRAHLNGSRHLANRLIGRMLLPAFEDSYNSAVLEAALRAKADVFLTTKGAHIRAETLIKLNKIGVKCILHYPDVSYDHASFHKATVPLYDLIVTTKSFQIETLLSNHCSRVVYIPHGYNPEVNRPRVEGISEVDYEVDIGYIGNHSADKQHWLEAVAAALPGVNMRIIGARWGSATALAPHLAGRSLRGDFASRAIQTSRINLAIHMGKAGSEGWEDLVSRRTFEIPACKGFMLHVDNPEVRGLYDVGSEIDVFSTPQELVEKIGFYLPRPELRAQMIERAHARAVPAYGYHERAKTIAREINALFT